MTSRKSPSLRPLLSQGRAAYSLDSLFLSPSLYFTFTDISAANLTGLAQVAQGIVNTTDGQALLAQLAQGNKTVFAPNNAAFAAVPSDVASDTSALTQILSYHIANNTYLPAGIQSAPNHTIARTLLRGGNYSLPGNKSAPVVLSKTGGNTTFQILQAPSNVNVTGPVAAANLQIYIIDAVLSLPFTISEAAQTLFPSLATVATQVGLIEPLEAAEGITIFAPNDSALAGVQSALGTLNQTQIMTILGNHVINGSVAYSDRLTTMNYTSSAGQPFTFMSNSTGTYVMSANSTARIVQSDIIVQNGVIHVIDNVLVNTMANPAAASSAYAAATSNAASQEPTAPVTATSSPAAMGSGASSSASSKSAGFEKVEWNFGVLGLGAIVTAFGAVMGGGWVLM